MANKHFFKPLLPGFHSHLTIPEAFFLKYVKGRNEQTMAKLRSDASKITWEVKIEEDGERLTHGWKEFALAHDLRIGDIVVFRQERHMAFHVTVLGPSCCEIQYGSCLDNEDNLEKIQRKKKVKKNPRRKAESSSLDPSCFVAHVSRATLHYDTLHLGKSFAMENGLHARCGEISLMNEEGRSWTLALKQKKSSGNIYITQGWRYFCHANELKAGDSFIFKLIKRVRTLALRMSNTESEEEDEEEKCSEIEPLSTESESDQERNLEEIQRENKVKSSSYSDCDEIESLSTESERNEKSLKKRRWKASSSSPSQSRFVTLTLTPDKFKKSTMFLTIRFTRMHGINEQTQMTLLDKYGVNWSTNLRGEKIGDRIRLVGGWKEFFKANSVRIGESITLELIWKAKRNCVLKFVCK